MSADGRYVAFESSSSNLAADDDNGESDIFVRDLQTNATTLVSRRSALSGNGPASDSSFKAAISADGRYVAFESSADNLSTIDDNAVFNVFVRDLQTGSLRVVSRRSAGGPDGGDGGNGDSRHPSLSADGRYVAFDSEADNLSDEDDNSVVDVFVRDLELDTTTLGSRQSGAGAGADGDSEYAVLSPDARLLAFDERGRQSEHRRQRQRPGRLRARPADRRRCPRQRPERRRRRCRAATTTPAAQPSPATAATSASTREQTT